MGAPLYFTVFFGRYFAFYFTLENASNIHLQRTANSYQIYWNLLSGIPFPNGSHHVEFQIYYSQCGTYITSGGYIINFKYRSLDSIVEQKRVVNSKLSPSRIAGVKSSSRFVLERDKSVSAFFISWFFFFFDSLLLVWSEFVCCLKILKMNWNKWNKNNNYDAALSHLFLD